MRRVILIILLLVLFLFGVTSLVCRTRIHRALNQSLTEMNRSPRQAYNILHAALARNNILTFGQTGRARQVFIESLVGNAVYNLNPRTIGQRTMPFEIARQSIAMLTRIETDSGQDLSARKITVIHAAYSTSNQILHEGSLSMWKDMLEFFRFIEANNMIPASAMPEFRRWSDQVRSMPVRDLAMRQETTDALYLMTRALNTLGLTVHQPGEGPIAMIAPADNGMGPLEVADKDLMKAADALNSLIDRYDDGSSDMALIYEIQGKILYNHAALMLTHALNQGAVSRKFGTGFVASFIIKPNETRVPPAEEMYREFVRLTMLVFTGSVYGKGAGDFFDRIKKPDDSIRAYKALIAWNCATCLDKLGRDAASYRETADRLARSVTDPRAKNAMQAMRASSRPLLIVELPDLPQEPEGK